VETVQKKENKYNQLKKKRGRENQKKKKKRLAHSLALCWYGHLVLY
jgi:hypothetical protein